VITDVYWKVIAVSTYVAFGKVAGKIRINISSILVVDFVSDVPVADRPEVCWILHNRIMTERYSSTFNREVIVGSKVQAERCITNSRASYNVKDIDFLVRIKLI